VILEANVTYLEATIRCFYGEENQFWDLMVCGANLWHQNLVGGREVEGL
jgi:hypothetical protein